ncbi:MAG: isoamylase early set domain-containing protein [Ignavibacteriae bacterium]|nr:isoamylase early set domain-containing protein [Ignavibacteriota bacterium]MCB9205990.1 isoamylase early set domain-containing protein [Ignavibacteriales bacterium]MCB9209267.1 isoamylase early set domain-containing protein [Ignavibacteriales bacterium]MCB9257909.1 isoamylase early set domain-containing protein [Ignavibacteriales bacterium]
MSISKKYLKSKPICKVTFRIPSNIGINHKKAVVLGSFNNWDQNSHRMKKLVKDGSFSIIVDMEVGNEYEFKYLVDDHIWLNDDNADKQVTTHYGDSANSVISV